MQQPFRFVHAADLHIDSPFTGLLEVAPEIAERLQDATFQAFRNLIDLCIREKVAFLVIAGDVYDGADRSVRAQLRFRDGLARLQENGIPSFIAHGNHDPLDGWASSIEMPGSATIFGSEPSWADARDRDGTLLARVQGVSYPTRVMEENLALRFAAPPPDGVFSIGVLHCNVGGNVAHDNYAPCSVDDLATVGIDYWALGHVHARQILSEQAPAIVYPGNLQGRHVNEPGPRGAVVVDVDVAGRIETRFVPLDVVRWQILEIDIQGLDGIDNLLGAVGGHVEAARAEADGRDLVCRVRLTGRGSLHEDLAHGDTLDHVLEEAQAQAALGPSLTWVERIEDATRPDLDIDGMAERDDFAGGVLRRAAAADPAAFDALLDEVFSGPYARPGQPIARPTEGEVREWIDEARWYLAEVLAGRNAEP